MRNRILLSDEDKARIDAAILSALANNSGPLTNCQLAAHLASERTGLPDVGSDAGSFERAADNGIARLKKALKIKPAYRTALGAARGGWRLA